MTQIGILMAVQRALTEAARPLHYREITAIVLERKFWSTSGATPHLSINAAIAVDIKSKGESSQFIRVSPGVFALAQLAQMPAIQTEESVLVHSSRAPRQGLTFPEAAAEVLKASGEPLHYREITKLALDSGLLSTARKTPAATMNSVILMEVTRDEKLGNAPRFERLGKGYIGLAKPPVAGLAREIEEQNQSVRAELRDFLFSLSSRPEYFEALVNQLLVKMGYHKVETTRKSSDGGIDVRGILVIAEVIHIRLAIQAKCWKNNVQSPTVQQVRGSLGSNEQGLIITTSGFSAGARLEAERHNAVPISLMDGEQLVNLLIEHELLVRRSPHTLLSLALEDLAEVRTPG